MTLDIGRLAGQRLGFYEVEEVIAHRSGDVVYRARHLRGGQLLALKVLPPHYPQDAAGRAAFWRRVTTVSRLVHPHILPVYDYVEIGDQLRFVVMKLAPGGALSQRLHTSVPVDYAVQLMTALLSALDYAHTREPSLVHGDITPNQILLDDTGWPWLDYLRLDRLDAPLGACPMRGIQGLMYLAPEQLEDIAVDHRVDLWAAGAILYELLTGQRAFDGPTVEAIYLAFAAGAIVPPSQVDPALVQAWDQVIQCSLAPDPSARYPDARSMAAAVQAAGDEQRRVDAAQ